MNTYGFDELMTKPCVTDCPQDTDAETKKTSAIIVQRIELPPGSRVGSKGIQLLVRIGIFMPYHGLDVGVRISLIPGLACRPKNIGSISSVGIEIVKVILQTLGRVAHPFSIFLLDDGSLLDDTTLVRQRGVTGFVFPGGRPFAIFEGSGFWRPLDSMANKLIRIYGRGHLHRFLPPPNRFKGVDGRPVRTRTADLYRVNFEVQQLNPFACLAFPCFYDAQTPQNSLVLVTSW